MSETVALTQGLPDQIRPGLVIAGKYRLEEQIGRGSMGTVYRAQHVSLGTRFAIKLISSEHSQSLEARKRFSIEAKAAAKLRSRHVVQVYDDGETPEGNPYIVLEYLDGETLEQRLEREHDVPLADAVRITSHVGRALARAHASGIVHRDLKPANVFLVRSDDDDAGWLAKVLDFGIAKLADHSEKGTTQAGTLLGTPLFMSPEQVRGASSVDHRADLYSLGMCLYHMLTGEFAFYHPSFSDVLIGICTEPLPLLRAKAPWTPDAVEQWFQRACAREPLERFQSADEMIEALAAAAGTSNVSKHQSVPEGRIAPETLLGYAAPAQDTLHVQRKAPTADALAVTSLLAAQHTLPAAGEATSTSPGFAVPSGPLAFGPPAPNTTQQNDVFGAGAPNTTRQHDDELRLPTRKLQPLWIGLGLGLLAVASSAATLTWLGGDAPAGERKPAAALAFPTAATARAAAHSPHAPTPAPAPEPHADESAQPSAHASSSSDAAEDPPAPAAKAKPQRAAKSQAAARPVRPSSSDLGF